MIRVFEPTQCYAATAAAAAAIQSGRISHGSDIGLFERLFAEYVGSGHCVAMSSCSAALEIAFAWHAQKQESRIRLRVPRVTFASVLNAALRHGDVEFHDEVYVNTDCPIEVTRDDGQHTVWDCAHTCRPKSHRDGISCYSFYPTKVLSGMEGGAFCTDDPEAAAWARLMSRNGISRKGSEWDYTYLLTGYKMPMTNVQASYLIAQLVGMENVNRRRDELAARYADRLPSVGPDGNYTFVMQCHDHEHRNTTARSLRTAGIETTVQFKTLDRQPHLWSESTLCLPLHMQLSNNQQDHVIEMALACL